MNRRETSRTTFLTFQIEAIVKERAAMLKIMMTATGRPSTRRSALPFEIQQKMSPN